MLPHLGYRIREQDQLNCARLAHIRGTVQEKRVLGGAPKWKEQKALAAFALNSDEHKAVHVNCMTWH